MSETSEALFAAFPVADRLTILSALQNTVILRDNAAARDEAADLLVRIGYASTAEAALKLRDTLAAL